MEARAWDWSFSFAEISNLYTKGSTVATVAVIVCSLNDNDDKVNNRLL